MARHLLWTKRAERATVHKHLESWTPSGDPPAPADPPPRLAAGVLLPPAPLPRSFRTHPPTDPPGARPSGGPLPAARCPSRSGAPTPSPCRLLPHPATQRHPWAPAGTAVPIRMGWSSRSSQRPRPPALPATRQPPPRRATVPAETAAYQSATDKSSSRCLLSPRHPPPRPRACRPARVTWTRTDQGQEMATDRDQIVEDGACLDPMDSTSLGETPHGEILQLQRKEEMDGKSQVRMSFIVTNGCPYTAQMYLMEVLCVCVCVCVCLSVCSRKRRQSGIFCGFTPFNRAYTSNRAYARFVLLAR